MDKNTAYKIISQFRANNCKSGALAIALDEALKALKPIAVNQVFCIKLEILDSENYYHSKAALSTLWLEASNNKKKMQAHIAEWSKDYSRGGSGFSWWLCRVGSS